jgi:hypothetical protein
MVLEPTSVRLDGLVAWTSGRGLCGRPDRVRVGPALEAVGVRCLVVAPSKLECPGDRIKNDRRDADRLARLLPQVRFDQAGLRVAFEEADGAVLAAGARRDRLDLAIAALAAPSASRARSPGPATAMPRRLLVEAAWHLRKSYRPSLVLQRCQTGQPGRGQGAGRGGNRSLHQRRRRLDARGKRSTISAEAVARELAGWCWNRAVLEA